jgi:hypothetical protein
MLRESSCNFCFLFSLEEHGERKRASAYNNPLSSLPYKFFYIPIT